MSDQLPSLFIGSSTEGLDIAREVELQLHRDSVTTIWKDGVFGLGGGTLESLMNALDQFDFAVMVLSPNDLIESRGQSYASPRDNVLFELGLFMGRLGRSRLFIVHEEGQEENLKLPSDLAGIKISPYRKRDDHNLTAALSPTCTPIIKAVRALKFLEKRAQQQIRRLEDQQESLSKVQSLISQVALKGIVNKYELDKLRGLASGDPFRVHYHRRMYDELRHLEAMQFVSLTGGHDLVDIRDKYSTREDIEFDLKEYFRITEGGREYLTLLEELVLLSPSGKK